MYFKQYKKKYLLHLPKYLSFLMFFLHPCNLFSSGIIFLHSEELPLALLLEHMYRWQILLVFFYLKCFYFAKIPEGYFCWM